LFFVAAVCPGVRMSRACVLVVVDFYLENLCSSISTCVDVLDTLASTTLHSIPTLTDEDIKIACRYDHLRTSTTTPITSTPYVINTLLCCRT